MKNERKFWREISYDALYGLALSIILILIILFSSGTSKFVYIDF